MLLVDDLVDSRWTLTYAGWLLREAGVAGGPSVRAGGRLAPGERVIRVVPLDNG